MVEVADFLLVPGTDVRVLGEVGEQRSRPGLGHPHDEQVGQSSRSSLRRHVLPARPAPVPGACGRYTPRPAARLATGSCSRPSSATHVSVAHPQRQGQRGDHSLVPGRHLALPRVVPADGHLTGGEPAGVAGHDVVGVQACRARVHEGRRRRFAEKARPSRSCRAGERRSPRSGCAATGRGERPTERLGVRVGGPPTHRGPARPRVPMVTSPPV